MTSSAPLKCDCKAAALLVLAKGLIDTLAVGEFDDLGYTYTTTPRRITQGGLATMKDGDLGDFKNYPDYLTKHPGGGYQGENVIKTGNDKYWGYPAGVKSAADWPCGGLCWRGRS